LDSAGYRIEPHFKSNWNWPLLLGQDFVSQLTVFRADLANSLGFRPGLGGAHDYDLLLRFAEKLEPHQIHHLPRVLYHRRTMTQSVEASLSAGAMKAVEQHLKRQEIEAEVTYASNKLSRRVRYLLRDVRPTVSIIIPTRDRVELLRPCVESILEKTAYSSFELILVDNGSRASATLDYLGSISGEPRMRVLRQDEEFNYSRLNNCGVRNSNAEFILLMNNDVNVIKPGWLEEMVSHGIQPGMGAVGARLLYPDNRVQQAGVILGAGVHGVAEVAHRGLARGDPGYFYRAILAQELSAVGAACMLVRREVYLEVGGFDEEHLKIAFNDIDFCLKLRARGYRIVYAPEAELYHHEHASRGTEYTETNEQRFNREIDFMKEKWKDALLVDRYYNPNLSLGNALFTLAFPPRVSKPWQSTY
jgi:GT2 family glycosyltransferase